MRRVFILIIILFISSFAIAQKERWDIRKGNRLYEKGEYQQAEINYRRALGKDSLSVKARYNLANVLYRNQNAAAAEQEVSRLLSDSAGVSITDKEAANIFHNKGNYSISQKKWSEAVESYKNSLRVNPSDMETKSNLAYAQKMLQNEQDKNQNKDQNKDQDKDQNKDDNKDQNQDQKQNQNQPPKITPQAAQQMLQAIQNKENETQDKVKKEKAKLYERQQREKNW